MNEWVRAARGIGLTLALGCSLLGCSSSLPNGSPPQRVRGTVTYKGKPLPKGYLHFYDGEGRPIVVGVIKPDGSGAYETVVPEGPVRVTVNGSLQPDTGDEAGEASKLAEEIKRAQRLGGKTKQRKLLAEIEEKYGSLRTAKPLTFVVGPGEQTWNIQLD